MKKTSLVSVAVGLVVFVFTAAVTYWVAVPRALGDVKDSVNQLTVSVTGLNTTMERIEPLVNEWVRASGTIELNIQSIKDDYDKLDTRVRELETGG